MNLNLLARSFHAAYLLLILTIVVLACLLAGCNGTAAAYREAHDPGEFAYVLSEHYAALVDQAATLKERGSLPDSIVRSLQSADDAAKPVILKLRGLRAAYLDVQNAQTDAQLQAGLDDAVKVISDMVRAVNTARGARTSMLKRVIPLESVSYEHTTIIFFAGTRADRPACGSDSALRCGARSVELDL